MRKFYSFTIALFLIALVATMLLLRSEVGAATNVKRIMITGSSTIAPLMSELAQRYEVNHPELRIEVETGGSSRGIADARRGVVDFGMVSRVLKPEESDLRAYTVAWDGIAMIVHSSNTLSELSEAQVRAIYLGRIRNWKELGGEDRAIVVVHKAQGRSTLELFLEHFLLSAQEVRPSTIIGDNQQGIKLVSGNPSAIGYVSIGAAEYAANNGVSIRHLPLIGIESTRKNVQNGSYPLRRPLNLVVKGDLNRPEVKGFIDYCLSLEANDAIEEMFFVPLSH